MSDDGALALRPDNGLAAAAAAADTAANNSALRDYRAGLSAQTRRAQAADLASWAAYLADVGVAGAAASWAEEPSSWAGVTHGLVAGFRQWLLAGGFARATVARRMATVRQHCVLAAQVGALAPATLQLIQTVHAPSGRAARNLDAARSATRRAGAKKATPTPLSPAQGRSLKQRPGSPQGRRDALLICLLLDHGLRAGEVAGLARADLDLPAGLLRFYRAKVHTTQTHRLTADTLLAATAYLAERGDEPGPLLLASARGGRLRAGSRLSTQAIHARVKALGAQIGAPALGPHDLRHAWATAAMRNGTSLRALQDAGGWASPAMPLRYAQAAAIANEGVRLG